MFEHETKKYCIRSGYILREIANEYAIIPIDSEGLITNAIMIPNDSAVFFWKAFQQPNTISNVIKHAIQEYNTTEAVLQSAVQNFVTDTLKYKILEEVE